MASNPGQPDAAWQNDDLRVLELPNNDNPRFDLVAAYARMAGADLELRFDLLGSPGAFDYDVYLALDTGPGEDLSRPLSFIPTPGWDLLFHFPARGSPRAVNPDGSPADIRPRIFRNSRQDSLIVRVSQSALPSDPKQVSFQAFLTSPGETSIKDMIGPVHVGDPPPIAIAPVALVFWDGLPSATPAQALRRWDGAHTGPFGQRHGLGVLLRAAFTSRIPIIILDLKSPGRLAALDALGGLPLVKEMQRENLLLLPDSAFGDPEVAAGSLVLSRHVSRQFGLDSNRFFFGALAGDIPSNYQVGFARFEDSAHIYRWKDVRLIPLPHMAESEIEQADMQGLTIETRLALLQTALSPDPGDLVILGGSLPTSPWGDSLIVGPAFEFLAGHPWIKVLDSAALLNFSSVSGSPDCPDLLCAAEIQPGKMVNMIRAALEDAPDNLFTQLAWQAYRSLTDPAGDKRLAALRANYLGQVGSLLAAADWFEDPQEVSACMSDLDWDGLAECILASKDFFLVFEQQSARLVLAAARTRRGPLQWIAPRSQFVVGLGDPSEWLTASGILTDPQEIPGAFGLIATGEEDGYRADMKPGVAIFTNPTNQMQKKFRLEGPKLLVSVESSQPVISQLPLVLLDRDAHSPGWYGRFQSLEMTDSTVLWELSGGATVSISAQAARLSSRSFTESLAVLSAPENPDFSYPPGHFIPFPMAVIDIQSEGSFVVEIILQD